ncbi:MAG: class I SAM-dependent methyltransferase, partial [Bacteroidales bacterium]|nr:class I SAM-dependent methyltransferase [Bacteroidales bacterium]
MLFLGAQESGTWQDYAGRLLKDPTGPVPVEGFIRPGLIPAFHFYLGMLFLSHGMNDNGLRWINAGLSGEQGGMFLNAFLSSYLNRNHGQLAVPEVIFADPAPYIHFAGTPILLDSRTKFRMHCVQSLPRFSKPLKIMDIGCGHGMVLVDLLLGLRKAGTIDAIEEVLLIDPSEAMLALAKKNVAGNFPGVRISVLQDRIEALSGRIGEDFDVALSSLAYHHMPYETKLLHLQKLKDRIGYFILFELDANNDTPGLNSPELALSVYQSYGALMDFVFANDAPVGL